MFLFLEASSSSSVYLSSLQSYTDGNKQLLIPDLLTISLTQHTSLHPLLHLNNRYQLLSLMHSGTVWNPNASDIFKSDIFRHQRSGDQLIKKEMRQIKYWNMKPQFYAEVLTANCNSFLCCVVHSSLGCSHLQEHMKAAFFSYRLWPEMVYWEDESLLTSPGTYSGCSHSD